MSSRVGTSRELEFVGTLGHGGFGSVYLAWLHGDRGWKRQVAVKVLNDVAAATPELHARQWDEARLLGLLAHEAIVQVVDVAEIAGRPAALMEYIEGVDVAQAIRAEAELRRFVPPKAASQIIAITAGALDAAYNGVNPSTGQPLRVIHRDIKPANLLLTPNGAVKVLDFGIARADIHREAVTRSISYGTPRYMAPEQWTGAEIGPGTDVYALGVTFYEALAGRPWDRPPLTEGSYQDRLAELLFDVPEETWPLLRAMLALEAKDRPTAAEVAAQAERLPLEGESLPQFARRVVPQLVSQRRTASLDGKVPARVAIAGGLDSPTPPGLMMAPPTPSIAVAASEPAARRPGISGLAVGSSVVIVGVLAWALFPRAEVVVPPPPEPAPVEVAPAAQPVVTAPVEPAPEPEPQPVVEKPIARVVTPKPATVVEAPPPAPVEAKVEAPAPAAPTEPAPATWPVKFLTQPQAMGIYIDGELKGKAPKEFVLREGEHTIEFEYDGVRTPPKSIKLTKASVWKYYLDSKTMEKVINP